MRMLYVGQLETKGWVSSSRMRMEELKRLGIDIVPLDVVPYESWGGKWFGAPFRRLKWGPPLRSLNRAILRCVLRSRPHVLWVDKGVWVYRETLQAARRLGVRAFVHYTPDPAFVGHKTRHFLGALPEYDLVVTTKAYETNLYQQYGARRLLLQYSSYDRDIHYPQTPVDEEMVRYAADLVFVGTYGPGREKYLRPLAHAGHSLVIWGSNWVRCHDRELRPFIRNRGVAGRDYALALGCAKIGLGILSPLWPDRSTQRSLEIPACGTFLLAERTEEHQALFEENKEAVFFSSEEELLTKARYYLEHEQERRRIAEAGRARCLASGYSSADRVKAIMENLQPLLS